MRVWVCNNKLANTPQHTHMHTQRERERASCKCLHCCCNCCNRVLLNKRRLHTHTSTRTPHPHIHTHTHTLRSIWSRQLHCIKRHRTHRNEPPESPRSSSLCFRSQHTPLKHSQPPPPHPLAHTLSYLSCLCSTLFSMPEAIFQSVLKHTRVSQKCFRKSMRNCILSSRLNSSKNIQIRN